MKRKAQAKRGRPSRRPEIIAATEALIRTKGLAGVTTRAIAQQVGCSEAALYVHFDGRLDLLLAVLEESLPNMLVPLRALEEATGKYTPQKNLRKALRAIYSFHERVIPMLGSLFADPELLTAYRESLTGRKKGPHGAIGRLQRYIAAEQELNRLPSGLDSEVSATVLMSSSFFKAFMAKFFGEPDPSDATLKKLVDAAIGAQRRDDQNQ
jgi:AcrR family transcriptional regulator